MIQNLNIDQIAVACELAIREGMFRYHDYRYGVYRDLAAELFEELEENHYNSKMLENLRQEYLQAQMYYCPHIDDEEAPVYNRLRIKDFL